MWNILHVHAPHHNGAAVHSLDAEFTVLEMTTSNAFFSRELKILYHFKHVLSCQRIGRD